MQARRLLATLFAAAMISTSCAALSTPAVVDVPPPPVDDTINTEAEFPDDGLTRLIVTPIAGAPAVQTGAGTAGPVPTAGAPGVATDPGRMLTPGMVAAMPPDAVLEARDGKVGYVDADGVFVVLEPIASAAPSPPVDEPAPEAEQAEREIVPLYGNPYIDALAADPAVENVTVIGDGTYGIETSDPSVVDPAIFTVVADVAFAVTEDQYERFQWHLENDGTNLDRVAQIAQAEDADLDIEPTLERADGQGIVVAVIDTGVDFSHPDLQNSAWSNLGEICGNGVDDEGNGFIDDCIGWDFAHNDAQPYVPGANPHGTHVAGIITANRDGRGVAGVAPNARIMDLNVAYANGSMSGAAITAAIRYAVDNGADIINMSLGTNPGASANGMGGMLGAIDYAGANGVLVVVAAGNSNVDLGSLAVYPANFNRPNMIVVGASAPDDTRASFSNFNADIVDLYAPGVHILSTMPGSDFQFMSGTSQASPATAAVAAMVMQTTPGASLQEVIDRVVSTVDPVDALSTSAASGRANAASALGLGDAPPIPTELDISVSGLLGAGNEVNAEVAIVTPPEVFDEEYRWELSLINTTDAGAYAIVEQPVVIDGVETATGATGAVVLGPSGLEAVAVSTQLPDGQYSFVIEAVPTADGAFRLGDAFVTTFRIGAGTVVVDDETNTTVVTTPPPTTTPGAGSDPSDGAVGGGADGAGGPTTAPVPNAPGATTPSPGGGNTGRAPIAEPGTPVTTAPVTSAPVTTASVPPAPAPPSNEGATSDGGDRSPSTTTPGSPPTSAPQNPGQQNPVPRNPSPSPGPTNPGPPRTVPTAPAPVPPAVGDGKASVGEWSVSSISPQAGYVDNANSVTIRGSFPSAVYVWFGQQPGQVVHQTDDLITVRTPLRSDEGVVDVSLRATGAGTVLTIPDSYAFVAWGGDQPVVNPPGDSGGGNGGGDAGQDDSNRDAADNGNDSNDAGDGSSNTEEGTAGNRTARMTVGSAIDLPSGLRGAAISPNPAANTGLCSSDPCRATRR